MVFACILFLVYITTRFVAKKTGAGYKGRHIEVVEAVSVAADKQLLLVRAGGQFFLIAKTSKGLEILSELELEADAAPEAADAGAEGTGFKGVFDKYLKRLQYKESFGDSRLKRNTDRIRTISRSASGGGAEPGRQGAQDDAGAGGAEDGKDGRNDV